MTHPTLQSARTLRAIALEQAGYFTAKQALEAGYGYPHLDYHVSTRAFERVGHGLYRLADFPVSEHDDLVRLSLWSRDRADRPQAVVSHDSALVLHDLTELLPGEIHLTVPPGFRKPAPRGVVLHKARLPSGDVEERAGFRVTTPQRSLLDAAASSVSLEQLKKAVAEALRRGMVRRSKLLEAARADSRCQRLQALLVEEASRGPQETVLVSSCRRR